MNTLDDIIQSINSDPGKYSNYMDLIFYYKNNGQYDEAISVCDDILSDDNIPDPIYDTFIMYKGISLFYLNNFQDALNLFDESITKFNTQYSEPYFYSGVIFHKSGLFEDAVKYLDEAIKLDDTESRYFSYKGRAQMELKMYNEAIKDFTKAIILNQNEKVSFYNRGLCYYHLGFLENALMDFNKTLELDPSFEPAEDNIKVIKKDQIMNRLNK